MGKYSINKGERLGRPNFHNGERRFACECGQHFYDGQIALAHALNGHDTVLEVFQMGRWVFRGGSVIDLLINDMRKRGENVEDFVSRIEKLADRMASEAEASDAITAVEELLAGE